MAQVQSLFSSPLVQVHNVCCTAGRSGMSTSKGGDLAHVCVIRRGCFHYHVGARTYFADPSRALIHDDEVEYRTSHPCDGGDDCTLLVLSQEMMEEAFGRRRRHDDIEFEMTPQAQVIHLAAYAMLRRPHADCVAGEEAAVSLVQAIAGRRIAAAKDGQAGMDGRYMVERAKALLNANLDRNLSLRTIARDAGCSPYYLMHLFRAHTGHTIRGYRSRLRAAAALERMAEGAWGLTDLALQCGFASHSHLTQTFRNVFGAPPSEIREQLAGGGLQDKRRFLEATLRPAA